MCKADLRKIGHEIKKSIRENAIKKYELSKNISAVARELSINRQVIHNWIRSGNIIYSPNKKLGRRELKLLDESKTEEITDILSCEIPRDKGIEGLFWTVESVRKLIKKKYRISLSAYLVRKYLKKWGFGINISKITLSIDKVGSVTLGELSKRYNSPCYYLQKVSIESRFEDNVYCCLTSLRGDIRFAGVEWWNKVKKYYNYEFEVFMIIKTQELAKKKIVIVIPNTFSSPYFHFLEKTKKVMLLKVENKVLKPIRLLTLPTKLETVSDLKRSNNPIEPSNFTSYTPPMTTILHIDMDAFYASIEVKDNPDLNGKPIMICETVKQRGIVVATSYEIRKYGVQPAMPTSQALRLCPHAIILPVRMERYAEISKQIQEIFLLYTLGIPSPSLEEYFFEITGPIPLWGPPEETGQAIKNKIKQELGLTASVGVAPNKFLAKLASGLQKPDGFVVITEENKQKILDPLNVSKIWSIEKATSKALQDKGINTIEQLRNTPIRVLINILGNQAEDILLLAQGVEGIQEESDKYAKSISVEETFPEDIIDKDILLNTLHNQVEEVAQRLRAEKVEGKTITLKLRYKDFKTITRSHSFDSPTNTTFVIWEEAQNVLKKWYNSNASKLRLLGFGVSGLVNEGTGQQSLFSDPDEKKQKKLDSIYDKIKQKYGDDKLKRG